MAEGLKRAFEAAKLSRVTKQRGPFEVGQIWRDMDKRMNGRHVKIVRVESPYVFVVTCAPDGSGPSSRETRLAMRRMYVHSTGFECISGRREGNRAYGDCEVENRESR